MPRCASFRAATGLAAAHGQQAPAAVTLDGLLDPDLQALDEAIATKDAQGQMALFVQAMSPGQHWTPAGLKATRLFWERRLAT